MRRCISLLLCSLLLGTILIGCSAKSTDDAAVTAATECFTTPTAADSVPIPTPTESVSAQLKEAEGQHAVLQDKLLNDPSLTQADMNTLAAQQYTLWDTLLNAFWAQLSGTLPQESMQQLLQEERAWIKWKEHTVALAADYYSGGSLSILAADMQAAKLTRDRVYELAGILTTQAYPSPRSAADLYRQVFLPLASIQQPNYENLLLLLEFRGFSLAEEEGIFEIHDPLFPGSLLFGSLSNETGILTIPQLGCCITGNSTTRGVRIDYFTAPPVYYIDAISWDDGTEVASAEELTAYFQTTY